MYNKKCNVYSEKVFYMREKEIKLLNKYKTMILKGE